MAGTFAIIASMLLNTTVIYGLVNVAGYLNGDPDCLNFRLVVVAEWVHNKCRNKMKLTQDLSKSNH